MLLESAIVARVQSFVCHPVFAGSAEVLEGVLEDLEDKAQARQISPEAFARLRDQLLASPHFRLN